MNDPCIDCRSWPDTGRRLTVDGRFHGVESAERVAHLVPVYIDGYFSPWYVAASRVVFDDGGPPTRDVDDLPMTRQQKIDLASLIIAAVIIVVAAAYLIISVVRLVH